MSRVLRRIWTNGWKESCLVLRNQLAKGTTCCDTCSFFTLPGTNTRKRKEYVGEKLVGFTKEEMYTVVSDVENYKNFVPFCKKSDVVQKSDVFLLGRLEIGFPPLSESYTSRVSMKRPEIVRADCTDGKLFDHLITSWKFADGPDGKERSCRILFYLSFQFKSALYAQVADMFFKELVREMEKAFITEAGKRFGSPSFPTVHLKSGLV